MKILYKLLISLAFAGFIGYRADLQSLFQHMADVPVATLVSATLLLLVLALPQALRWQIVLRAIGAKLPLDTALPTTLIGWFFNQVLPSSVGGDAFRIWYAYRAGIGLGLSTYSVALDRLTALVAIVFLVVLLAPWIDLLFPVTEQKTGIVIAALILLGIWLGIMVADRTLARLLPTKARVRVTNFSRLSRRLFLGPPVAPAILLSLLIHLTVSYVVWMIANAMGLPLQLGQALLLIPLVLLITAIPISIAGWGVREGVMLVALGQVGIDSERAVALSVLFGLVTAAAALPGGVVWLLKHHERPRLYPAVSATDE